MLMVDLPMPEACDRCPFNYDFCWCNAFNSMEEYDKVEEDWNLHVCDRRSRPEYCPLKELEQKPLLCESCIYHRNDGWCNEHGREVKKTDYCSFGAWEGL